jgi:hypothetical protein
MLNILVDTHFLAAVVAAIAAVISAILARSNKTKLEDIHISLNSRLDALIEASISAGRIAERSDISSGIQNSPPKDKEL